LKEHVEKEDKTEYNDSWKNILSSIYSKLVTFESLEAMLFENDKKNDSLNKNLKDSNSLDRGEYRGNRDRNNNFQGNPRQQGEYRGNRDRNNNFQVNSRQ
jgi:hypothetical protein